MLSPNFVQWQPLWDQSFSLVELNGLISLGMVSTTHLINLKERGLLVSDFDRDTYAKLYLLPQKPMLVWGPTKFKNKKILGPLGPAPSFPPPSLQP